MRGFQGFADRVRAEVRFEAGVVVSTGIVIARGSQVDQAIEVAGNFGEGALPKVIVGLLGVGTENGVSHWRLQVSREVQMTSLREKVARRLELGNAGVSIFAHDRQAVRQALD